MKKILFNDLDLISVGKCGKNVVVNNCLSRDSVYSGAYYWTIKERKVYYTHFERLSIPAEMFVGDSGKIFFLMWESVWEDGQLNDGEAIYDRLQVREYSYFEINYYKENESKIKLEIEELQPYARKEIGGLL